MHEQVWTFDGVGMRVTLVGFGRVTVELRGMAPDGFEFDGEINFPQGPQGDDLNLVSDAIRGNAASARKLFDKLTTEVRAMDSTS